jgi:hypothetical protein
MKVALFNENIEKIKSSTPYVDVRDNEIDFCLGKTRQDVISVTKEILSHVTVTKGEKQYV